RTERRTRHQRHRSARPPNHGSEMPKQRRSGSQPMGQPPPPPEPRRNQVRYRHGRGLRMVQRPSSTTSAGFDLSAAFFLGGPALPATTARLPQARSGRTHAVEPAGAGGADGGGRTSGAVPDAVAQGDLV